MSENLELKNAILEFVQQIIKQNNNNNNNYTIPEKFSDLQDGSIYYYCLTFLEKNENNKNLIFKDLEEVEKMKKYSFKNKILKKSILSTLVRHMNDYIKLHYIFENNNNSEENNNNTLLNYFDPQSLMDEEENENNNNNENENNNHNSLFLEFSALFLLLLALSKKEFVLNILRQMKKETQIILSNSVKNTLSKFSLKKNENEKKSSENIQNNNNSENNNQNNKLKRESDSLLSIPNIIRTRSPSLAEDNNNNNNNENNKNKSNSRSHSLIQKEESSFLENSQNSNNNNNNENFNFDVNDNYLLRKNFLRLEKKVNILENEKKELNHLLKRSEEELHSYKYKYKTLLEENNNQQNNNNLNNNNNAKDKVIIALEEKLEKTKKDFQAELKKKNTEIETISENLKNSEELYILKCDEKRELNDKYTVIKDRLSLLEQSNIQLQTENEEINAENKILSLKLKDYEELHVGGFSENNNNNNNENENHNNIMHTVRVLENEIEELKSVIEIYKNNSQNNNNFNNTTLNNFSTLTNDENNNNNSSFQENNQNQNHIWKIKLKQTIKEKETIQLQLTSALLKIEELQNNNNNKNNNNEINLENAEHQKRYILFLTSLLLRYGYNAAFLKQNFTQLYNENNNHHKKSNEIEKIEEESKKLSFLSIQRREIEKGLFNSVLYNNYTSKIPK